MRIKVFTFVYNEERLLPFLLSHYRWADHFHAFAGMDSTDRTVALLEQAAADAVAGCTHVPRKVTWEDLTMPNGFDDGAKIERLNHRLLEPTADFDWHCVVDSDEFTWPPNDPACETLRPALAAQPMSVTTITSLMLPVYRHVTDSDLDPTKHPVVLQRRHGEQQAGAPYGKMCWTRPNHNIQYAVGCHHTHGRVAEAPVRWHGAHWQYADPSVSVDRRLRDRRDRISARNRACGWGTHCFSLTEQAIMDGLKAHENDPQVI